MVFRSDIAKRARCNETNRISELFCMHFAVYSRVSIGILVRVDNATAVINDNPRGAKF